MSADWISPGNGPALEYRYNPPAADGSKVIVNDTDHLWGHGAEVPWVWKSFTRGLNVLFMDPWQRIPGEMGYYQDGSVSTNQRYYYRWDDVRRNMGYTHHFAQQMDLNRCLPHNALCSSGFCLANPGQEYLCFFPAGGAEGVNLRGQTGNYRVQWFNPVTGQATHSGDGAGRRGSCVGGPLCRDGCAISPQGQRMGQRINEWRTTNKRMADNE